MITVHMHHVIGRCLDHLSALCQKDSLQYIDHLGKGSNLHTIAVLVKDVQGNTGDQCIPDGILLIQETRIRSGLCRVPGSPFVHTHADLFLWIIVIHDRAMTGHQFIHI